MRGPVWREDPNVVGYLTCDNIGLQHIWGEVEVSREASPTARARGAVEGFYVCLREGCTVARFGREV